MSLAELHANYTNPLLSRGIARRITPKSYIKIKKQAAIRIRRTKVKTVAASRRQYFISTAYRDLKAAAAQNEDIVIMSVTSVAIMAFAALVTVAEIFLNFFLTAFIMSETISMNLMFVAAIAAGVLTVLYAWFTAFLINLTSISVMDGAVKKVKRSVRLTFRKSLQQSSQVATAWLLLLLVITIPLIIVAIGGLIWLQITTVSMEQLFYIMQFAVIGGIAWLLVILMQYSLVPYVVLFEKKLPAKQCLARSKQLVKRRGRIFILAWYMSLGMLLAFSYALAVLAENSISLNKWFVFASMAFPIVLIMNGILVMFYRKRRLARTN